MILCLPIPGTNWKLEITEIIKIRNILKQIALTSQENL